MGTNREEIGRIVKRFRRECDSEKARDAGVLLVDRGSMLALLDALDAPGEGALEGPDAERILADLAKGCSAEEAERRIARAKEELRKLRMPPGPREPRLEGPSARMPAAPGTVDAWLARQPEPLAPGIMLVRAVRCHGCGVAAMITLRKDDGVVTTYEGVPLEIPLSQFAAWADGTRARVPSPAKWVHDCLADGSLAPMGDR